MRSAFITLLLFAAVSAHAGLRVVFDTAEPEQVLAIADSIARGDEVTEELWTSLFATGGYRDLKTREAAMKRAFTDDEFREFVGSPAVLGKRDALRTALDARRRFDAAAASARAMRYLPRGTDATVTVYTLIKPKPNSFVFRTDRGMAIFLYLDPDVTQRQFENTVVHELHHIGYDAACADVDATTPRGLAMRYLGGFGEGLAMLAAAGSAETHPHATSGPAERAVWDRDVARLEPDLRRLEGFFTDILDGKLAERAAVMQRFMALIATEDVPQGAFYTVGWVMASTIERVHGRDALVGMTCDPVQLVAAYHEIATREGSPTWSDPFVLRLSDR